MGGIAGRFHGAYGLGARRGLFTRHHVGHRSSILRPGQDRDSAAAGRLEVDYNGCVGDEHDGTANCGLEAIVEQLWHPVGCYHGGFGSLLVGTVRLVYGSMEGFPTERTGTIKIEKSSIFVP